MKILKSSLAISEEITLLIRQCVSCQIAVAWASVRFLCFESLVANKPKIDRMVVGLHFAQTHPDFIQAFLNDVDKVRFVHNDAGVFHPKVYLFKHRQGWDCVVGSPNFTKGAFMRNTETAVLINHEDVGADAALAELTSLVDGYWDAARILTEYELAEYRTAWRKARKRRTRVQKETELKVHAILPELPTELSASAFSSKVRIGIKQLPGVSNQWRFSRPGETLKLTFRYSGEVAIQLYLSPRENKCYFEAVSTEMPTRRDPVAASIRAHMKTLRVPEGSVLPGAGAGIIRLAPPLHVKQLLNQRSSGIRAKQQQFDNEATRVVTLFRFIDNAMQSWSVNPK